VEGAKGDQENRCHAHTPLEKISPERVPSIVKVMQERGQLSLQTNVGKSIGGPGNSKERRGGRGTVKRGERTHRLRTRGTPGRDRGMDNFTGKEKKLSSKRFGVPTDLGDQKRKKRKDTAFLGNRKSERKSGGGARRKRTCIRRLTRSCRAGRV